MAKADQSLMIKTLRLLLKFGIAAAVLVLLFRGDSRKIAESLRDFRYVYLIPAALFYLAHIGVCAWRWRVLAKLTGVEMSGGAALSLTMQGYFFSLVIPGGAIGGDVIKMAAVSRRLDNGTRTEGAFSVLMDRIIGMLALFVLALALMVPARRLFCGIRFPDMPEKLTGEVIFLLVLLLCVAGLTAGIAVFFYRKLEKIPGISPLLRFSDRHTGGMITRIKAAIDTYGGNWRTLVKLTVLSIFGVHLMTVVPMFFLLAGANCSGGALTVIAALTFGNIAGLIPLFPGGIGGRDVTVAALLVSGGLAAGRAEAAQLLYTAIMVVCCLSGGLFFIFDPGRKLSPSGGGK